jgi:hypothetical protein
VTIEAVKFLSVQVVLMFGFSLAFYWLSAYGSTVEERQNGEIYLSKQFVSIYRIAFSDFDEIGDYDSYFNWIFFAFCHFLISIIILTLLIGIISEKLADILAIKE